MSPINGELPPCLFPLCNSPVLLYVLNWLSVSGIEKIYVLCRSEDEKIIAKVTSQCATRMLMENIQIVPSREPASSIGDCIRIIEKWNAQFNAFSHCIVVPGTLVTNVQLQPIINEHIVGCNKKNSEEGFQQVITTVFTQGNNDGYSIIEGADHMILKITPSSELEFNMSPLPLSISPKLMKKVSKLHVRTLLHDASIYILSAQAFLDFSESFDWNDVCKDCIPTQLHLLDLTKHTTHMAYCPDAYAQTIDDLPSYINTSLALVRRWLYPVTVEMNFFAPHETSSALAFDFGDEGEEEDGEFDEPVVIEAKQLSDECTAFRLKRDLVYLYDNVFPSLSSKIGHSVVIGSGTQVEDGAVIKNSIIGSSCVIGKNAVLENCIVWDRVTIGEGVRMDHCLIASDVTISDAVTIQFGSIVSFNCEVFMDLPPCRRLTVNEGLLPNGLFQSAESDTFSSDESPCWLRHYIRDKVPLDLDEERCQETGTQEFIPTPSHEIPLLRMWLELNHDEFPIDEISILNDPGSESNDEDASFNQEEEDIKNDEEEDVEKKADGEEDSKECEEDEDQECMIRTNERFQTNAHEIIIKSLDRDEGDISGIIQEVVSLKNTTNASNIDVSIAFIHGLVDHFGLEKCEEGIELFEDKLYTFLEERYDQVDLVFWWQWYCATDEANRKDLFIKVLQKLSDEDIVTEEAMDEWLDQQEDSTRAQIRLYKAFKEQFQQ
jgi:translation initiation factor eIF-2B subunit epsilon